ncbi:MAG TPA: hypothetical protein VFO69_01365 [Allosphingosinicella sp.]|nr:hypothetical protein [Allosphingosinicella sp.]
MTKASRRTHSQEPDELRQARNRGDRKIGFLAIAALAMMSWPVPVQAANSEILIPTCGGGFHPLQLPGPDEPGETESDAACHSACLRKRDTLWAQRARRQSRP